MVDIYFKKRILSFKWPRDGMHTFNTNRWHINIAIVLFHASFIYLWYGCNNVTYKSYDTYNTCVPYNTYSPYRQMGTNCTYGACGTCETYETYGAYGTHGTCGTFGGYGACGTCVTYVDEKCGTFVANVVCGTYVTHVPYLQMVHSQRTFQMNIDMCLQMGLKIK
jgi:hypothetical protein